MCSLQGYLTKSHEFKIQLKVIPPFLSFPFISRLIYSTTYSTFPLVCLTGLIHKTHSCPNSFLPSSPHLIMVTLPRLRSQNLKSSLTLPSFIFCFPSLTPINSTFEVIQNSMASSYLYCCPLVQSTVVSVLGYYNHLLTGLPASILVHLYSSISTQQIRRWSRPC